jgi:Ribosome-binding factor A
LRAELSDILQHHMKDPRLNVLLSITEVQVAPDLKSARVYVSIMGDEG